MGPCTRQAPPSFITTIRTPPPSKPSAGIVEIDRVLKTDSVSARSEGQTPGTQSFSQTPLWIPAAFIAALALLASLSPVRHNGKTLLAFEGAVAVLLIWTGVIFIQAGRAGRALRVTFSPKKPHWIQACAQASVFIYWGIYWPEVRSFALFIVAQLFFAYAFDILLCWSRRDECILGFAQFPVIFSINLFLWFKPDWFYLQFLMVAVGLTAKEFVRWNRDGRSAHIFNPSSLPLALFSLALLATGKTNITWGQEIATTQFYPPQMYLWLFLIGLPAQLFFGVTSMTMSAVVSAWLFSKLYFAATGIYFFYDSYIPIAVFLGMHLLFNDPATSPKTESGRIFFGALYGVSTAGLYELLGRAGLPMFYDKLLQVPLLNLSVIAIDTAARSRYLRWLDPGNWGRQMLPIARNLAWIAVWAAIFAGLSFSRDLSDWFPGQFIPFWQQACDEDRPFACPYLADMQSNYCDHGSGWACNEAGRLDIALSRSGEDTRRADPALALQPFSRGCEAGFAAACHNRQTLQHGGRLESAPPGLKDLPIILRGSKGEIHDTSPAALYQRGCKEGWTDMCLR